MVIWLFDFYQYEFFMVLFYFYFLYLVFYKCYCDKNGMGCLGRDVWGKDWNKVGFKCLFIWVWFNYRFC